jgi:hypothetical protein
MRSQVLWKAGEPKIHHNYMETPAQSPDANLLAVSGLLFQAPPDSIVHDDSFHYQG